MTMIPIYVFGRHGVSPNCGGTLSMINLSEYFICPDCGSRYRVVEQGQHDREVSCKELKEKIRG